MVIKRPKFCSGTSRIDLDVSAYDTSFARPTTNGAMHGNRAFPMYNKTKSLMCGMNARHDYLKPIETPCF